MSAERGRSLRAQFPKRHEIPALLAVGAVLLPLGLTLPTVTLSAMAGISGATYSVITGALNLAKGGNVLLALLIFTFSLMFPILKLGRLSAVWFHGMEPDRRERALHALRILGKWSMLDVFVAVSLVGAIQFGFLATATPRIGIYLFSTAVLRRSGPKHAALVRTLEEVDKWIMIDVFALGVLIVAVQLGGIADVSPPPGLGCFLASVILSASESWLIRV